MEFQRYLSSISTPFQDQVKEQIEQERLEKERLEQEEQQRLADEAARAEEERLAKKAEQVSNLKRP